eukprot:1837637-Rhodomonas_salina.1
MHRHVIGSSELTAGAGRSRGCRRRTWRACCWGPRCAAVFWVHAALYGDSVTMYACSAAIYGGSVAIDGDIAAIYGYSAVMYGDSAATGSGEADSCGGRRRGRR